MSYLWKILAGVGVGAGVYFAWTRIASATEDSSGDTVDPKEAKPPTPTTPAKPALGAKAVEVLTRHVGAMESPKGSNRGPVVDQIIRGVNGDGEKLLGKPWCARAVRYAYEKAAQELGQAPPFAGVKPSLAAVNDWADIFKQYLTSEPKTGHVGLILSGGTRHATLVSKVDGETVYTVEGNHSDSVATVKRPRSKFKHFVDVQRYVEDKKRS